MNTFRTTLPRCELPAAFFHAFYAALVEDDFIDTAAQRVLELAGTVFDPPFSQHATIDDAVDFLEDLAAQYLDYHEANFGQGLLVGVRHAQLADWILAGFHTSHLHTELNELIHSFYAPFLAELPEEVAQHMPVIVGRCVGRALHEDFPQSVVVFAADPTTPQVRKAYEFLGVHIAQHQWDELAECEIDFAAILVRLVGLYEALAQWPPAERHDRWEMLEGRFRHVSEYKRMRHWDSWEQVVYWRNAFAHLSTMEQRITYDDVLSEVKQASHGQVTAWLAEAAYYLTACVADTLAENSSRLAYPRGVQWERLRDELIY